MVRRAPSSIDAAIFTNSGAESIEAALKLARAATGRPRILYCDRGFHGLTLGSLSVNGNDEFRERFGPLLPGCDPVPFGDTAALAAELRRGDVAAFIVEPVQGKGVYLAPDGLPAGGSGRSAARPARCWSSTRCRPDSAAPAGSSPPSTGICSPT